MKKCQKQKRFLRQFLEDHIGISIFFSLLSTGIQSFVVHIGSGGEGKVEFEPKISLLGLLFLTTIFYVLKVCLQVLICFNKLLMFYGSIKGSVSRGFRPPVFFMIRTHLGP